MKMDFKSSSLDKFITSIKPSLSDFIWEKYEHLLDLKYKPMGEEDKLLLDVDRLIKLSDDEILYEIDLFMMGSLRRTIHTLHAALKEVRQNSVVIVELRYFFYSLLRNRLLSSGVVVDSDDNIISNKRKII